MRLKLSSTTLRSLTQDQFSPVLERFSLKNVLKEWKFTLLHWVQFYTEFLSLFIALYCIVLSACATSETFYILMNMNTWIQTILILMWAHPGNEAWP